MQRSGGQHSGGQPSVGYILGFATAVCVVCGILVSSSAVSLKDLQEANAELEKMTNVLFAAGLAGPNERLDAQAVEDRFAVVEALVIRLETGEVVESADPDSFDQQKAKRDPSRSDLAPANNAGIKRLPQEALVYRVFDEQGDPDLYVFPIEGLGLWSTLYGFIALSADLETIRGLTYYQHGETPGLGGEVDNADWKALWRGRRVFDEAGAPTIEVINLAMADPARGRFRSFLLTAVKNFLASEWKREGAKKRGGGVNTISLDYAIGETRLGLQPADTNTPEAAFDRNWAVTLLEHVLARLETEYSGRDKSQQFHVLKQFLAGRNSDSSLAEAAKELDMSERGCRENGRLPPSSTLPRSIARGDRPNGGLNGRCRR